MEVVQDKSGMWLVRNSAGKTMCKRKTREGAEKMLREIERVSVMSPKRQAQQQRERQGADENLDDSTE